jgi:hypothetical protein
MRRLLATLVTACALPVHAEVVELNANAGFDRDIAGVVVLGPPGGAHWSPNDLSGDAGSGSLMLSGPAGRYTLLLCVRPAAALPAGRYVFDFSLRSQGTAPATLVSESIFAFGGDDPVNDGPCDGPWTAYLRYAGQAPVAAPAVIGSSIPTAAFPLLHVIVQVDKSDAGAVFVDDWSVRVDTDVVFRDPDGAAQLFTL